MRKLPAIDGATVRAHLERHWGIRATSMDPIFRGDNAYSYAVRDDAGAGWFVKLYGDDAMPHVLARLTETVELAAALREDEIIDNTPRHRRNANGGLMTHCASYRVVVQELVAGEPPVVGQMPAATVRTAGSTAAALHAGTASVADRCPFRQGFEPLGDPGSRVVAMVAASDSPLAERSRAAAQELAADVAAAEQRVEALRPVVAQSDDLVLVHADYQGDNMLVDAAGSLWVLDWDTLQLAPREHNLALMAWFEPATVDDLVAGYAEASDGAPLSVDSAEWYLRRYVVGCVAAYGSAVLRATEPGMQASWADGMFAWCMRQLGLLDERLDAFGRAIERVGC